MNINLKIVFLLFFAPLVSVSAQTIVSIKSWVKISNSMYLLPSAEGGNLFVSAYLKDQDAHVALVMPQEPDCAESNTMPSPTGPYTVNKTEVRFTKACFSGNALIIPTSQEGEDFLKDLAEKEKDISVDTGDGNIKHYSTAGYHEVEQKLKEMGKAI